ncbi:MAG: GNAT family N-acetyltransferase [Micropruina sp.]|nr:GNAT family N-acetyltransferase [Micropruina sp.]
MIADSVRLALPNEAEGITAVQRRSWEATVPPEIAGPLLASVSEDEMVQRWCEAIVRPPNAKIRVLVAVSGELVVGFACVGPSGDPDADLTTGTIAEFVVDPRATRRGHGSRLLNACADTLGADGFTLATFWVRSTDDVLRGLLAQSGWAPDGAHEERAMDDDGATVKLLRLHTDLRKAGN